MKRRVSPSQQYGRNNGSGERREVKGKVTDLKDDQGEGHMSITSKRRPLIRSSHSYWTEPNKKSKKCRKEVIGKKSPKRGNRDARYNLRPRRKVVESRLSSKKIQVQRGPVRCTGRRDQQYSPTRWFKEGQVEDFGKRNMPGKRARSHFSQLSEFERGLIIGIKTAGWSTRRVAGRVDRSECAIRNCWEQWTREVTRSTIRADVGVAIVPQTISRHLAEANLKFKHPFRALALTPEHRQLRVQWCQARSMWNVTELQKVVFSDESRFVLGTDDNHVRVWRHPVGWYNSPHTHCSTSHCLHSWCNGLGAIAYDSRSTLIVMRGTLTGQRYVDDILRPHVGPFLNGLPGAIFQQDNACPHTARVAQDFLRHFQTLPWPARSPGMLKKLDISIITKFHSCIKC
ncbi:transposable element Tc1 transposase [Trichonephila clavipes]|nr:transposable element Tc1 transposase [Trichonephila clavipes]